MVTFGASQGFILNPLLFFTFVNYIWRNFAGSFSLFAENMKLFRNIVNDLDVRHLQQNLKSLKASAYKIRKVEKCVMINSRRQIQIFLSLHSLSGFVLPTVPI